HSLSLHAPSRSLNGSASPCQLAVAGMNCAIPAAPFGLTACASKRLSCQIHERAEYRMHLFGDRVTLALGNLGDGDGGYTTVTTVGADPNATVDSSRC